MKTQMKAMARPYLTLFGMALIVAVVARIGLGIMDATGALAYDYISASDVAILDTICSILTGSAFVAFMFAASLALTLSVAGVALYAAIARREGGQASAASAFLWGWATALVAIVCLVIVGSGILSAVQVGSMSSKLPGTGVLAIAAIVFAAFLGTLLGAASMVAVACVRRAKTPKCACVNLLVACAVCGLVVMVLTVGTFSTLNHVSIDTSALGVWFAADAVVNIAMLLAAGRFAK